MTDSLILQLAALASVFLAAFTQGVTGFGFGMVAMALLPFFINARDASVLNGMFSLVTSSCVLFSVRRSLRWRDISFPILGMVTGIPLGVYALMILDETLIRRLVGVAILLACAQMLAPGPRTSRTVSWPWALASGFISGILGGAFGIGGPPVIAYASIQNWDSARYKAMLCSFFAVSNLYRVLIMLGTGLITTELATQFALGLPVLLLGVFVGIRTYGRLSRAGFRRAVVGTLAILALTLLFL